MTIQDHRPVIGITQTCFDAVRCLHNGMQTVVLRSLFACSGQGAQSAELLGSLRAFTATQTGSIVIDAIRQIRSKAMSFDGSAPWISMPFNVVSLLACPQFS